MADKKQEALLKKSVKEWNQWREKNPSVKINLYNADLRYANLYNANLSNANLTKANLTKANLRDANLMDANLRDAELRNVVFRDADLQDADLRDADIYNSNFQDAYLGEVDLRFTDLRKAIFRNAYLGNANLSYADLSDADFFDANLFDANLKATQLTNSNFTNSELSETIFGLTNLGAVKGLDTVRVSGECSIDFQTLHNSKDLPKSFLLKIGLPENYINYLPDFYDESPLRLFPVFLSHSWSNKDFAGKLYDALIKRGVQVWYDEKKLKPGDKIMEGINKAINVYDKMILVCSKQSLQESWWVEEEMKRIFKKEREYLREKKEKMNLMIPIMIDDFVLNWNGEYGENIRDKKIGDFRGWENDETKFERALDSLIEALNVDRKDDDPISRLNLK